MHKFVIRIPFWNVLFFLFVNDFLVKWLLDLIFQILFGKWLDFLLIDDFLIKWRLDWFYRFFLGKWFDFLWIEGFLIKWLLGWILCFSLFFWGFFGLILGNLCVLLDIVFAGRIQMYALYVFVCGFSFDKLCYVWLVIILLLIIGSPFIF